MEPGPYAGIAVWQAASDSAGMSIGGFGTFVLNGTVYVPRANVQFFRRVRVGSIEIRGKMAGEIIAEGTVTVRKNAVLEGSVTAKAVNVERRGVFSGQLVIGRADLQQAELLPEQSEH